jgi:hypothetical protein
LHFWPENEFSEIKCLVPTVHVQPLGGIRDIDGDSNETVKLVSVHGSLGLEPVRFAEKSWLKVLFADLL